MTSTNYTHSFINDFSFIVPSPEYPYCIHLLVCLILLHCLPPLPLHRIPAGTAGHEELPRGRATSALCAECMRSLQELLTRVLVPVGGAAAGGPLRIAVNRFALIQLVQARNVFDSGDGGGGGVFATRMQHAVHAWNLPMVTPPAHLRPPSAVG